MAPIRNVMDDMRAIPDDQCLDCGGKLDLRVDNINGHSNKSRCVDRLQERARRAEAKLRDLTGK